MKRFTKVLLATTLLAAFTTGCKEEYTTYSDAEYVMFADTASLNMVLQDQDFFQVPVSATTACDYDRTFGVEVIDSQSKAIEGVHFTLKSNTITIKAGERRTNVLLRGMYDNFAVADTMSVMLRLVMPEQLKWDLYGDQTRVKMLKRCPYTIEDFTGWCVVTSMFLNTYPGAENKGIQRLIQTEKHPTKEHTVILHDFLFTNYDVEMRFDASDPNEPLVYMDKGQVLGDEFLVFGQIRGDNKILVRNSPYNDSYFDNCEKYIRLWIYTHVEKLGVNIGTVGVFENIVEWISDEEAERLQREEGMIPHPAD